MPETIRCAIVTVSDRSAAGQRPDLSGAALEQCLNKLAWSVSSKHLIPDEFLQIKELLQKLAHSGTVDLILTIGGTGFSPRDVTPEATQAVIEKNALGLVEAMRAENLKINTHAMLSRACAGICASTLIVNLPGNPNAAVENFNVIAPAIPHAIALLHSSPDSEQGHQLHPRGDSHG